MARTGSARQPANERAADTRRALVSAACDVLRTEGFAGATARVIADRADVNQGLVFYHFDSVVGLLLAAVGAVSATRQARYGEAVAGVTSPAELVEVASSIYREDLDTGHVAVLVATITGAASTPGLGEEVAQRIEPWARFARDAITGALADSPLSSIMSDDDLGFAVVALYLGMEMLTQLDGNHAPATALFDQAMSLTTLLGALGGSASGDSSRVTDKVPTS
ncbi:MAG: TetR/AcrR family transcriptional regulator [Acidimicrobiales bacterium]